MHNRELSPPVTSYHIVDIRSPDKHPAMADGDGRPPSPPASNDPSLDAFNSADLVDTILGSLSQPHGKKSISTFVLYDTRGLQLFDQITLLDEYYLTNAERSILEERADQIIERLQDGSVLIELGSGALRKTQLVLQAIERKRIRATYYALDLDQHELERSLASLGEFEYVSLVGLLGTYDQGIPWLSEKFVASNKEPTHKVLLWLGSSIGNQSRYESSQFLRRLQRTCLQPGDLCVIGFDRRNEPERVKRAYDDSQGVTRDFIMNGLDHVNAIVGQPLLDRNSFEYDSRYQEQQGRHMAHYRALHDMTLRYPDGTQVPIIKDELIHVEYSHKYSMDEIQHILNAAELNMVDCWIDPKGLSRLVLAECRPFLFERDKAGTRRTLLGSPSDSTIGCEECDHGVTDDAIQLNNAKDRPGSLVNVLGTPHWPTTVPTMHEWQQLWRSWDLVTLAMLDHATMLFERPIALRHPFLFYLGHIPAFLDRQLALHAVDHGVDGSENGKLTQPVAFAKLFERGIDPDMNDPTLCNPHSEVPTQEKDWPSTDSILAYQQKVRHRLARLLLHWETLSKTTSGECWDARSGLKRKARIVWMCFEHEAMHLETLLYMLLQSPNTRPPLGVVPPAWKMALSHPQGAYAQKTPKWNECLTPAPLVTLVAGSVTLGHMDDEADDDADNMSPSVCDVEFGWDNEHPKRTEATAAFNIQSRPVTNGEYLAFVKATNAASWPASWTAKSEGEPRVKTVFGECPMAYAMHWPVQVSYAEAQAYAAHHHMRLPTEVELVRLCRAHHDRTAKTPNMGFSQWHPTEVDNDRLHLLGDVWEWTSTVWDSYASFKPSVLYPGYSADFFDHKHHVVLGGSWATHPRIAERRSFRNWYQTGYPYVFSGFRCVVDA